MKFRVEESGQLTGAFDVQVDLNVEAARALVAMVQDLVERVKG